MLNITPTLQYGVAQCTKKEKEE